MASFWILAAMIYWDAAARVARRGGRDVLHDIDLLLGTVLIPLTEASVKERFPSSRGFRCVFESWCRYAVPCPTRRMLDVVVDQRAFHTMNSRHVNCVCG